MNWQHKIKIRDISEDDNYDTDLRFDEQKKDYAKEMTKRLSSYKFIPANISRMFVRVKTLSGFNKKLNELYDWCDFNLVWVEF